MPASTSYATTPRARANTFDTFDYFRMAVPDCHRGGWLVRKRDHRTLPAGCDRFDCANCMPRLAVLFGLRLAMSTVRWQPAVIDLTLPFGKNGGATGDTLAPDQPDQLRAQHRHLHALLHWLRSKRQFGHYAWCREVGERSVITYLLLERRPVAGWREAARRNRLVGSLRFIRRPAALSLPAFAARVLPNEVRDAIPTRIAFAFARECMARCGQTLPPHMRRFATSVPRLELPSEWFYTETFPADAPNAGDYADYPNFEAVN